MTQFPCFFLIFQKQKLCRRVVPEMEEVHRPVHSRHVHRREAARIRRVQVSVVSSQCHTNRESLSGLWAIIMRKENNNKNFNSTVFTLIGSSNGRRSSGSRHVSSTTVSSTEAQSQSNNNATTNNVQPPLLATTGQQPTDVSNVPAPAPPVNPTLKCEYLNLLAFLFTR